VHAPFDLRRLVRSVRPVDSAVPVPPDPVPVLTEVFVEGAPVHASAQPLAEAARAWLADPGAAPSALAGMAMLLTVEHAAAWLAARVGWERVLVWLVELDQQHLFVRALHGRPGVEVLELGVIGHNAYKYWGASFESRCTEAAVALAAASEEDWSAAVQTATRLWETATPAARAGLAIAMPDQTAWVDEALRASPALAHWLVPLCVDLELIERAFVERLVAPHYQWQLQEAWPLWQARLGEGALTLALRLAEAELLLPTVPWTGARLFDGEASARIGLGLLGHVDARRDISAWMAAHPEPTLRVLLAPGAPAHPKVLRRLTRGHPALAARLAAELGAEALVRPILDGLQGSEAAEHTLPAVLRDAPWRRKSTPFKRVEITGLTVPDPPVTMAKAPPPPGGIPSDFTWRPAAPLPAEVISAPAGVPVDPSLLYAALRMPDPDLQALSRVFAEARPDWYGRTRFDEGQLHYLVKRLGPGAFPGLLRQAPDNLAASIPSLARFDHPAVAPFMALAVVAQKSRRRQARTWLRAHPTQAVEGLVPAALGPMKPAQARKAREAAELALGELAADHRAWILEVATRHGPAARAAIEALLARSPYEELPQKPKPLSPLIAGAGLEAPVLRIGGSLPSEAVIATCELLAVADRDNLYLGLTDILEACTPESLARFGADLVDLWSTAGYPAELNWVLPALVLLGDDSTVDLLEPLILAWPHESAHQRAKVALEVLAGIGTDHALARLHRLSSRGTGQSQRKDAAALVAQVAAERGLSPEEMADRLVPDLGLDDDGTTTLSFGARSFLVALDPSLKPVVREPDGTVLKDLPKPRTSDDADAAKEALAAWSKLKKDARDVAKVQLDRLEQALVHQRRWRWADFQSYLLRHPLLVHVVRGLIWGAWDDAGTLVHTFRVDESRELADVHDDALPPPVGLQIGLMHPLHLADADAWRALFVDYEIVQPFRQLDRSVHLPTDAEREATALTRFQGKVVPWSRVKALEGRGWRPGRPQDAGLVMWWALPLPDELELRLFVEDGVYAGAPQESGDQTLGGARIVHRRARWEEEPRVLGTLGEVVFSEVIEDLGWVGR
jgi:hypothetical protein